MALAATRLPVPVGIYARISSDREGDQLGVTRQIADCEGLAQLRGCRVMERYVDDDISAWSGARRPQYERMLADLRSGRIRGVLVWHLDRLTRHPRELEAFLDLCDEVDVELLGCVTGDVDLADHGGRLLARMLGGLARYESDHKSERIRRKHLEIAESGGVSGGGSRPYGYEDDKVTIRPAEAAVVAECAKRLLAGEPVRSIVADLNSRGIHAAKGGPWSPQSLRRMLASPRISGQRVYHGEILGRAKWPGIISAEDGAAHEQGSSPLPARRPAGLRPLRRASRRAATDGREAPLRLRQGRGLRRMRQDLHQRRRGGALRHRGGTASSGLARPAAGHGAAAAERA
jgi:site-specific DNA recombinase